MKYHACVTSALNQKIIDQPMADELNADIEAYRNKAIKEGHSEAQLWLLYKSDHADDPPQ